MKGSNLTGGALTEGLPVPLVAVPHRVEPRKHYVPPGWLRMAAEDERRAKAGQVAARAAAAAVPAPAKRRDAPDVPGGKYGKGVPVKVQTVDLVADRLAGLSMRQSALKRGVSVHTVSRKLRELDRKAGRRE